MFVFLPIRQKWACQSCCHCRGREMWLRERICEHSPPWMSRSSVHHPIHHPAHLPGASLQGPVSFWVSNIPSVGKENDVCKGANCSCLSKARKPAERWGSISSSESSPCPAALESSARVIYSPVHQRMLHSGLGFSFKAECLEQG